MSEVNLHPSVQAFKEFLKDKPKLIEEIRGGGEGFQKYYEKWALLGDEDPFWKKFESSNDVEKNSKQNGKQTEWIGNLMETAKKTDFSKIKEHAGTLNETLGSLQEMLSLFQNKNNNTQSPPDQKNLFHLFKD